MDFDYGEFARSLSLANKELLATMLAEKDVVSGTPNAFYGHGPNGLFSTAGVSRPIFNAVGLPRNGLLDRLNWHPTNETDPIFLSITGVTDSTGSEPTGVCDDPPEAGLLKACAQTFPLGRHSRQTRVFDIDRVGKVRNRGEFTDLQLYGGFNNNNMAPTGVIPPKNSILNTEAGKALFELAVAWQRDFGRKTYTGDPANNTAGGGYKEFRGFDLTINTGKVDSVDGTTACNAIDSWVYSMGGVDLADDPTTYTRRLISTIRKIRELSAMTGLAPVKLVIAMRGGLFYEWTEHYPVNYATFRNANDPNANMVTFDGFRINAERDAMRQGRYFMVDGEKIEVVIDDNIIETHSGGQYTTSVYIVPLTVLNGVEVTYGEYIDYTMANGAMDFARRWGVGSFFSPSDGGRFLWHFKPPNNFCVQWLAKTEPRIIMLTPQFAARFTDVKYTPFQHEPSPWTDEYDYRNGGVYIRA